MRSFLLITALITAIAGSASADQRQVAEVTVSPPSHTWILTFHTNGSVHAQYGSTPGDGASIPAGSFDFPALLDAVRRLESDEQLSTAQAAIRHEGQASTTAFYLRDDTLIRYLTESFRDDWRPDPGGDRFHQLLEDHPMFPEGT
jgi:hypothetical protein